jgi:hypothetical protein
MGMHRARLWDFFRAAKTWAAGYVGSSGWGTNPTNAGCRHTGRALQEEAKGKAARKNTAVDLVHHCFVCGLELTHEIEGEERS